MGQSIGGLLVGAILGGIAGFAASNGAPAQERQPTARGLPVVFEETVKSSNGSWTRITGKATVVNAYTLRFETGTQVDLRFAMDAPELDQKGLIGDKLYPCGKEAAEYLAKLIGDHAVTLFEDGESIPGKKVRGPCFVGEKHLQMEMVRNGWAVSAHSGMDAWEIIARENKRGLWRGQFVAPKKWRDGERLPGEMSAAPR